MNHSNLGLASFTPTAKLMLASLPAAAILLTAVIALTVQPSSAKPSKTVVMPDRYPAVNWPALGAGDYSPATATVATVIWPALGAGDFAPVAPTVPAVNWPALGAGDFERTK